MKHKLNRESYFWIGFRGAPYSGSEFLYCTLCDKNLGLTGEFNRYVPYNETVDNHLNSEKHLAQYELYILE